MMQSFLEVHEQPNQAFLQSAQVIGLATIALCHSTRKIDIQSYVTRFLEPAVHHRQISILFDDDGFVTGFIIWAWLSKETELRMLAEPATSLHLSEWDEGERLWIVDIVALNGRIKYLLRYARDVLFPDVLFATYAKIKARKILFKRIERKKCYSFFSGRGESHYSARTTADWENPTFDMKPLP